MDRIIYTAMTGANAAAHRQAVLSNNLANASTQGFRAEMSTFRSVPIQGDGSTTRVFALEATSGHVSTPGPAQTTGRNLDAMAQGNAWFAVQGLDGTEAYTRAGQFEVSNNGQLDTPGLARAVGRWCTHRRAPQCHGHAVPGWHRLGPGGQRAARGSRPHQAGHGERGEPGAPR